MYNPTISNVLAAGVAIVALVLVIVNQVDIKVGAMFVVLSVAVLLKPTHP